MNTTARRHWEMAAASLADAEELHGLLERNPLPHNDYWCDAVRRADELVTEMRQNLNAVQDLYTPEQVGP